MEIDPRLAEISDCLYRISAKAVIVRDATLLLVREKKHMWWGLPGGGVDHGETIEQALCRELNEEIGVPPGKITTGPAPVFVTIGAALQGIPKANLFYTVGLSTETINPTDEVDGAEWFSAEQLSELPFGPSTKPILPQLIALLQG